MVFTRGTSTNYKDLLTKVETMLLGDHVLTITMTSGGTGGTYVVGDILTVAGGTTTNAARILVTAVSAGVITASRLYDAGEYTVDPSPLVNNPVTGGGGTGATFTLTMEVSNWAKNLDDSTLDSSTERVVLFEETVNNIHIGFRTYTEVTGAQTAKNWMVIGASGFNGALPWYQQPDISPSGFSTVDGSVLQDTTGGAFMVLKDADTFAMDYWMEVTDREITVFTKMFDAIVTTPRYSSMYAGLLNQFGTSAEFPYPLYVEGCSAGYQTSWDDLVPAFQYSGLSQCMGIGSRIGPGLYFHNDGLWKSVQNSTVSSPGSSTRSERNNYVVYPVGNPNSLVAQDVGTAGDSSTTAVQWENICRLTSFLAADHVLQPTPDSTSTNNEKRLLVPLTLIISLFPDVDVIGELDGLFWASAAGTVTATSEDTITDPVTGDIFIYFENGVYNQFDGYTLFREALISG